MGAPCHEVHELVDDVAVEPCQRSGNAAEDDSLGHEQPDFIHIETLVGGTVQGAETACQLFGYRLFFACMSNIALKALADYEKQMKAGVNPVFKAKNIDLKYETDYWN